MRPWRSTPDHWLRCSRHESTDLDDEQKGATDGKADNRVGPLGSGTEEKAEKGQRRQEVRRVEVERLARLRRGQVMGRFTVRKLNFGAPKTDPDDGDDDGRDLPRPRLLRLQARRAAGIREAKETLAFLPAPGEALHALCTARMDLTDVINALLEKLGRCDRLVIGTLGYNERNLQALLRWLDTGAVGSLTLLASLFFRAHKGELWEETLREFRSRKQRAACCHSHAKVVALAFASGSRLCIEGSANLCGNGSGREQLALINDAGLHDWHAQWISELVEKYE
jgi:hypothetical protein